jgi:uncharacterized membrane protein
MWGQILTLLLQLALLAWQSMTDRQRQAAARQIADAELWRDARDLIAQADAARVAADRRRPDPGVVRDDALDADARPAGEG